MKTEKVAISGSCFMECYKIFLCHYIMRSHNYAFFSLYTETYIGSPWNITGHWKVIQSYDRVPQNDMELCF